MYPLVINEEATQTSDVAVSLYIYGDQWQEMRLRNDEDEWGDWQTFSNQTQWTLNDVAGTRTVSVEMRNATTTGSSADVIELVVLGREPASTATPTSIATQTPTAIPDQQPVLIGKIKLNPAVIASQAQQEMALRVDFVSISTSKLITTVNLTTDSNGQFTIRPAPIGEFDIAVKGKNSLRRMHRVTIGNGTTEVDFGEAVAGDIVPDNEINLLDFSAIAISYGNCLGMPDYSAQADLDGNGCIDAADLGLLKESFGEEGSSLPDESAGNSTPDLQIAKIEAQSVGKYVSVDIHISCHASGTNNDENLDADFQDFLGFLFLTRVHRVYPRPIYRTAI